MSNNLLHPSLQDKSSTDKPDMGNSETKDNLTIQNDKELQVRILAAVNLVSTDYKKNLTNSIQSVKTIKYNGGVYFRFAKTDLVKPHDVLKIIMLVYGIASFSDQTDSCIQRYDKSRDLLSDHYYYKIESSFHSDLVTDPKILEEKNKLLHELTVHVNAIKSKMRTK